LAEEPTIAVVGLGYVSLPLAIEFARLYKTFGIDQSSEKIAAYRESSDPAGELDEAELRAAEICLHDRDGLSGQRRCHHCGRPGTKTTRLSTHRQPAGGTRVDALSGLSQQ